MKGYAKNNYEAHKRIFSIFWENIFNIEGFRVFKLLWKKYSKIGNKNSASTKASSQAIQRDQFRYFWSYTLKDMNFRRLMYLLEIKNKKIKKGLQ